MTSLTSQGKFQSIEVRSWFQDRAESDRLGHLKQICEEIDLTSQQLAAMLDEAKLSSRGKISLILDLFSRIVDREEFYEVEEKLTSVTSALLRSAW